MEPRATLNISLPESLRQWVDEVVKQEGYSSASELVRELIRGEQKRRAVDALEKRLIASLNSGPAREISKAEWESKKRSLRELAAKHPSKKSA